jgi:hypothetical protein
MTPAHRAYMGNERRASIPDPGGLRLARSAVGRSYRHDQPSEAAIES